MIWLTWRQHRIEAAIVLGALALLAALLIVIGLDMRTTFDQLGIANCLNAVQPSLTCGDAIDAFRNQYGPWLAFVEWLNLIPILLAILIGAPLVARELEHGTHRLVWTQSVTRWRWLAIKLLLVLGGCVVVTAVVSLLLTWWLQPWDIFNGRFINAFDFEGTVMLGYVLFALALAIAAGALLRRAIPAMVVTLAGFLAVRLPVEFRLRPFFQHPLTAIFPVGSPAAAAGPQLTRADWEINTYFVDHAGHALPDRQVYDACLSAVNTKDSFFQCVHAHGWMLAEVYQPADRFWTFQVIETAVFVALALALLGLAIYWVRARVS